jgi:hypothetical protein
MQLVHNQRLAAWLYRLAVVLWAGCLLIRVTTSTAQEKNAPSRPPVSRPGEEYAGMYSFLQEGEFVQITVEDAGRVTGFVSRYGDLDSDKGAFLDHFFKTGKLDGNKLLFTTEVVHGTSFDFAGTVDRGEGKKPGDEAYYVLRGKLTETTTDAANKTASRSRDVTFRAFPRDASPDSKPRN